MFILFDILYVILSPLYFLYLTLKKKWHKGFSVRFGNYSKDLIEALKGKENIWIHAVSVGEVLAIQKLIRQLRETFPFHQIVLTTVTKAGYKIALEKVPVGDIVLYAPIDLSFVVRKVISLINPKVYVLAETELWPNILAFLQEKKVPIIQINGRISDKSFEGYQKWNFLFKNVIRRIHRFCMQSDLDGARIIALGADPKNVSVVGNVKFDVSNEQKLDSQNKLHTNANEQWWVAGSTHPGEEETIISIYEQLKKQFTALRLIIAPRHVERSLEIGKIVEAQGLKAKYYSKCQKQKISNDEIVVVDAIGHLKALYQLASVVFVGKSLTKGGGQNIIEPASLAKPIMVGPLMENFRDVMDLFQKDKAIVQVADKDELREKLTELLKDEEKRKALGQRAKDVVIKNAGTSKRTAQIISGVLMEK